MKDKELRKQLFGYGGNISRWPENQIGKLNAGQYDLNEKIDALATYLGLEIQQVEKKEVWEVRKGRTEFSKKLERFLKEAK